MSVELLTMRELVCLLGLAIVLLWLILLRREVLSLGQDLGRVLRGNRLVIKAPQFDACRPVAQALEALSYRGGQPLRQEAGEAAAQVHELIGRIEHPSGSSRDEFLKQLMHEIRRELRAKAIAVSYFLPNSDGGTTVSIGVSGKRFARHLESEAALCFEGACDEFTGLHDGLKSESIFGHFAVFGFRHTIIYPFRWELLQGQGQGVLWLGYPAEQPPAYDDPSRALTISKKLEKELTAYEKLVSLSIKAAQAQERSEMLAHISHDIRSPLNNIRAILNLFKLEGMGIDAPEMIEAALKNCDGMMEIVQDLLDFSRHRIGGLTATRSSFDLKELLSEVLQSFSVAARTKGLNVSYDFKDAACVVHADRTQLKRVFSNLISNAIKYTVHGGLWVVTTRDTQGQITVSVRDSGLGMSEAQVQRLFLPFMRFHEAASDGIGLGLALSKALLDLNGAAVAVSSAEGQGTEFRVTLSASDRGEIEAEDRGGHLFNMSVLLVDDDRDCVDSLARVLAKDGCQVRAAYGIQEAFSILNYECPDAVVTDDQMPGGGGNAVIEFIQTRKLSTSVAVLSGSDGKEAGYLPKGVSRVFLKPADAREIKIWLLEASRKASKLAAA